MGFIDSLLAKTGRVPRKGSRVDRARAQQGVGRSAEWRRIAALPRRRLDLAEVPDLSPVWRIVDHGCMGCELCASGQASLRPVQSAALLEAEAVGGLLALIGVGGGKELLCLLLPDALGAERALILTKARLKAQMLEVDVPRYGKHFRLPMHRIAGVASYDELSSPRTGPALLARLKPDVIIANEGHRIANREAARTKRFAWHLDEVAPGTRLCVLSATLMRRLRRAGHLAHHALGAGSPLPHAFRELDDWSRALDPPEERADAHPLAPGALLDLCGPEDKEAEFEALPEAERVAVYFDQAGAADVARKVARRVFRRRLQETPGVVVYSDSDCDASLIVAARHVVVPPEVAAELDLLRRLWKCGDEELSEATEVAAKARQLSCGFRYRWAWPGEVVDEEWLEARGAWHKALRNLLRRSRPGRDSPLLISQAVERGEIDCPEWWVWKAVKDRPKPPTEAVWVSDFLVRDAVAWAGEDDVPGIVWYQHAAVGAALADAGLKVYFPGDDAVLHAKERVICLSVAAFGEGLNLQYRYSRNYVLSPPSNGSVFEQMVGRTHRSGQRADEVTFDVPVHDASLRSAIAKALEDARCARDRDGAKPKLLLAQRVGIDELVEVGEVWGA